ncbi:hypothetical protein BBK36DRAFT_1127354 [Trichoderma citrinoviride]|uniref:Uncharacterized protein n=1 Tax=Trichoderma citrinoviride TaxID=58853 RepID=A0A2T4B1J6_9HYPO|nr:hypothetical protein BBK36DRAFT_1127354 [Trichoderma citrinoviride]PTB63108.1 hypothetical protein BBK36DRAFT_1127354 [Trichoderma citrinoviride]
MPPSSKRSFTDDHRVFTTNYSQALVIANTVEPEDYGQAPKCSHPGVCDHDKLFAGEKSSGKTSVKFDRMLDVCDPSFSMSRLAMNAAPCLRCLFHIQDGDATRMCLNYIWKDDNGPKSCVECIYDGKDQNGQGGFTPSELVSTQLRFARHQALQAALGGIKDPAEAIEMADLDALYLVHRTHECEVLKRKEAAKRKEASKGKGKGKETIQPDKKPKHRVQKTNSGKAVDGKSNGESSTTELPIGDTYPRGFGVQLAHVTLLRKVWKQNENIQRQLEAQGVILSAIIRGQVSTPLPLDYCNEEMMKSAKLSCQVLEKLLDKFEVHAHGLELPDQLRKVAMEL